MKILITSPSLNVLKNVSGIASHTKLVIDNADYFVHFRIGRKDNDSRNFKWVFAQVTNILKFSRAINLVDGVHLNMPMEKFSIISGYFYAKVCEVKKKPLLVHIRGGNYSNGRAIPSFMNFLLARIFLKARCVLLLSKQEKTYMENRYAIRSAHSLPNCVFVPRKLNENKYHSEVLNIVYAGRIVRDKGMSELLSCLDELHAKSKIHCYIAGSGDNTYIDAFKRRSFISYKGVCNPQQLRELYNSSAIFILPSYFEGMPNSMLEAMAFGCAPVVTDVGAIREVVDNRNGRIVNVGDSRALFSEVSNLVDQRSVLESMGTKAHSSIYKEYNINNYVRELKIIHEELIND